MGAKTVPLWPGWLQEWFNNQINEGFTSIVSARSTKLYSVAGSFSFSSDEVR